MRAQVGRGPRYARTCGVATRIRPLHGDRGLAASPGACGRLLRSGSAGRGPEAPGGAGQRTATGACRVAAPGFGLGRSGTGLRPRALRGPGSRPPAGPGQTGRGSIQSGPRQRRPVPAGRPVSGDRPGCRRAGELSLDHGPRETRLSWGGRDGHQVTRGAGRNSRWTAAEAPDHPWGVGRDRQGSRNPHASGRRARGD